MSITPLFIALKTEALSFLPVVWSSISVMTVTGIESCDTAMSLIARVAMTITSGSSRSALEICGANMNTTLAKMNMHIWDMINPNRYPLRTLEKRPAP